MIAGDIMTNCVVTVGPGHSIRHAVRLMLDNRISGLPVVDDDDRLVGMITEGDMLRREELGAPPAKKSTEAEGADSYVRARSWRVSDVMSRTVVSVSEDTSIRDMCALMVTHDVNRLPVMRGSRLLGIVSRLDLLRVIAAAEQEGVAAGDNALARAVRARLHADLQLREPEVRVAVRDGFVTLSGAVADAPTRAAARVAAETVRGVAGVDNNLAVLKTGNGRSA